MSANDTALTQEVVDCALALNDAIQAAHDAGLTVALFVPRGGPHPPHVEPVVLRHLTKGPLGVTLSLTRFVHDESPEKRGAAAFAATWDKIYADGLAAFDELTARVADIRKPEEGEA